MVSKDLQAIFVNDLCDADTDQKVSRETRMLMIKWNGQNTILSAVDDQEEKAMPET